MCGARSKAVSTRRLPSVYLPAMLSGGFQRGWPGPTRTPPARPARTRLGAPHPDPAVSQRATVGPTQPPGLDITSVNFANRDPCRRHFSDFCPGQAWHRHRCGQGTRFRAGGSRREQASAPRCRPDLRARTCCMQRVEQRLGPSRCHAEAEAALQVRSERQLRRREGLGTHRAPPRRRRR